MIYYFGIGLLYMVFFVSRNKDLIEGEIAANCKTLTHCIGTYIKFCFLITVFYPVIVLASIFDKE